MPKIIYIENENISTEETINGNDMEEIQPNEENTLANNNQITSESKLLEAVNDNPENEEKEWKTIEKKKDHIIAIDEEHIPGKNKPEKIRYVENILDDTKNLIGIKCAFKYGKKRVLATYNNPESANKACNKKIAENNDFHFELLQDPRHCNEWAKRSIRISDIPLDIRKHMLKEILEQYGEIERLALRLSGRWYVAIATYKKIEDANKLMSKWSIDYMKENLRITHMNSSNETLNERKEFTLKLSGLPYGTTYYDIIDIVKAVKGKSCFIPRTRTQYGRARYAFIAFENEKDQNEAATTHYAYKNNKLSWVSPNAKTCHKCGDTSHLVIKCPEKEHSNTRKENLTKFNLLYKKFKISSPQTQNTKRSYASIVTNNNESKKTIISKEGVNNFNKKVEKIENDIKKIKGMSGNFKNPQINLRKRGHKTSDNNSSDESTIQIIKEQKELRSNLNNMYQIVLELKNSLQDNKINNLDTDDEHSSECQY
ncbi:5149_t:CDS:2 [Entrophospora sp. SA101]|nr:5149_t:CDS:2 [Entrophospora sp. SA101]